MRWDFTFDSVSSGLFSVVNRLRRRRRRRADHREPSIPWWVKLGFAALLGGLGAAQATTVTPPTFPELVAEAQVIAEGSVTAVDARWVDGPQGRVIKTFVTFAVEKPLKGAPAATLTLELLGGTVGADTLHVAGMPAFAVGQHEIVFVRENGVQFCPLVRMMHGRYHVRTETGSPRHYVTRDDDTPLASTADVQQPVGDAPHVHPARAAAAASLTPDEFEAQITAEVARHRP